MPQNAFSLWTHELLVSQKVTQRHFFPTLHPLSLVISATATAVAFVLLHNSRFNSHCYTQCETTPTQKSAWKWCCDLLWFPPQKITKRIHSCKPASLNHPIPSWGSSALLLHFRPGLLLPSCELFPLLPHFRPISTPSCWSFIPLVTSF